MGASRVGARWGIQSQRQKPGSGSKVVKKSQSAKPSRKPRNRWGICRAHASPELSAKAQQKRRAGSVKPQGPKAGDLADDADDGASVVGLAEDSSASHLAEHGGKCVQSQCARCRRWRA